MARTDFFAKYIFAKQVLLFCWLNFPNLYLVSIHHAHLYVMFADPTIQPLSSYFVPKDSYQC